MSMSIVVDRAPDQTISFVFLQDQDCSLDLKERYDIQKCVDWIKRNNFTKVCLQFPENYLSDSVEVALLIEEQLTEKTYIIGDTSFGSCCVDEIAAGHVPGDALIHFGHACLTPASSLPTLYILPKRALDFSFIRNGNSKTIEGPSLIVYDVGYHHLVDEIVNHFPKDMIISELLIDGDQHTRECCDACSIRKTGKHSVIRFSRGFCLQEKPNNVIYLGSESDPLFTNFAYLFKESQTWVLHQNELVQVKTLKLLKQLSFYVEEVKAASSVTLVVVALSIPGVLDAIAHAKALGKRWNKRVYVVTIAKPNIAKLTNFPEMEVFVVLGCPETHLINNKDIVQPVVGLLEMELALNEHRTWDSPFSKDFRDLIPGGQDYIPVPSEPPKTASDVSNLTGRLSGQTMAGDPNTTDLAISSNKSLASTSSKTGGRREKTWFGLEQSLGETPVALAAEGRTGTSTEYRDELQ